MTPRIFLAACVLLLSAVPASLAAETLLRQSDFRHGTVVIDRPGTYRLAEDISFNPNSPETLTAAVASGAIPPALALALELPLPPARVDAYRSGRPLPTQFRVGGGEVFTPGGPLDARYDPAAFGLGFFAAIVVAAEDVVLDLGGHTIAQSAEHALLQRFFSVVSLADRPFVPGQGPSDFGAALRAARNVVVRNGTIGRSAHHGIHGNANENVTIRAVDFVDYEVAAVALNGVRGLTVEDVTGVNRKDVPVLGTWSAARFIAPYLDELVRTGANTTLTVQGRTRSAAEVRAALRASVNRVHADVVGGRSRPGERAAIDRERHPDEHALFHNPHGVVDGNSYSFLVNPLGVAVNGFPSRPERDGAEEIVFRNVRVRNQVAFVNEVVALDAGGDAAATDPVGAVWQVYNVDPATGAPLTATSADDATARYRGNVVADAQVLVAKAVHEGAFAGSRLDVSRSTITPEMVAWAEGRAGYVTRDRVVGGPDGLLCNGDSMFHVNKGAIAFKLDGARDVRLVDTSVSGLVNRGTAGSWRCGDYAGARSHPAATLPGYGGARVRAYSFAGTQTVGVVRARAERLRAVAGDAVGFDLLTDSRDVVIRASRVEGVSAGAPEDAGPGGTPAAIGVRAGPGVTDSRAAPVCVRALEGPLRFAVRDESVGGLEVLLGCPEGFAGRSPDGAR